MKKQKKEFDWTGFVLGGILLIFTCFLIAAIFTGQAFENNKTLLHNLYTMPDNTNYIEPVCFNVPIVVPYYPNLFKDAYLVYNIQPYGIIFNQQTLSFEAYTYLTCEELYSNLHKHKPNIIVIGDLK